MVQPHAICSSLSITKLQLQHDEPAEDVRATSPTKAASTRLPIGSGPLDSDARTKPIGVAEDITRLQMSRCDAGQLAKTMQRSSSQTRQGRRQLDHAASALHGSKPSAGAGLHNLPFEMTQAVLAYLGKDNEGRKALVKLTAVNSQFRVAVPKGLANRRNIEALRLEALPLLRGYMTQPQGTRVSQPCMEELRAVPRDLSPEAFDVVAEIAREQSIDPGHRLQENLLSPHNLLLGPLLSGRGRDDAERLAAQLQSAVLKFSMPGQTADETKVRLRMNCLSATIMGLKDADAEVYEALVACASKPEFADLGPALIQEPFIMERQPFLRDMIGLAVAARLSPDDAGVPAEIYANAAMLQHHDKLSREVCEVLDRNVRKLIDRLPEAEHDNCNRQIDTLWPRSGPLS
jgi:hypothetical protein